MVKSHPLSKLLLGTIDTIREVNNNKERVLLQVEECRVDHGKYILEVVDKENFDLTIHQLLLKEEEKIRKKRQEAAASRLKDAVCKAANC